MKVTKRDLFNYCNPARIYSKWLKDNMITDGPMLDEMYVSEHKGDTPDLVTYAEVLEAKRHGNLAGEQLGGGDGEG